MSGVSGSAASDLVVGLNTLTITLTSSDDFLEGVRFQGSVTGDGASLSASPEPAAGVLFLSGLGALALVRRRAAIRP